MKEIYLDSEYGPMESSIQPNAIIESLEQAVDLALADYVEEDAHGYLYWMECKFVNAPALRNRQVYISVCNVNEDGETETTELYVVRHSKPIFVEDDTEERETKKKHIQITWKDGHKTTEEYLPQNYLDGTPNVTAETVFKVVKCMASVCDGDENIPVGCAELD